MSKTDKILILRFSAMGDVAMTAPVIQEFRDNYPDTPLIIVSRSLFRPFFEDIAQTTFHAIEPKGKHKGLKGLIRLYKELSIYNITAVADLHYNLRSRIISFLFRLSGVKTRHLDKGRPAKRRITRFPDKTLSPLKPTVQRYADVFGTLGFPFVLKNILPPKNIEINEEIVPFMESPKTTHWIGVSPFAQHQQKIYPYDKMESVLLKLAKQGYKLFIFGGGVEETAIAAQWSDKHPNIISVVSKMNLANELRFISHLDLMLSMDSSGMHLASLKGIPVVSVWGATHPFTGFLGYGQSMEDAVQIDLECRPCSVYGNKPCFRGDMACMNFLSENMIVDRVVKKLKNG